MLAAYKQKKKKDRQSFSASFHKSPYNLEDLDVNFHVIYKY